MAKNWRVASTKGVAIEASDVPTKPGTPASDATGAPSLHAVPDGEQETACGRPVDELGLTMLDRAWETSGFGDGRCRECVAAVNADLGS